MSSSVVVFILSAGHGRRLRPLTYFYQKTLLPVGWSKRIVDYSLEVATKNYSNLNVKTIVNCRYLSWQVIKYVNRKYRSVEISLENEILDTGGALLKVWYSISQEKPEAVIILNGDHYHQLDIEEIFQSYYQKDEPDLMLLTVLSDERRHDYVDHEGCSLVLAHSERNSRDAYTGMCVIKYEQLDKFIRQLKPRRTNLTELLRKFSREHSFTTLEVSGPWEDLGTWKRFLAHHLNKN